MADRKENWGRYGEGRYTLRRLARLCGVSASSFKPYFYRFLRAKGYEYGPKIECRITDREIGEFIHSMVDQKLMGFTNKED